MSMKPTLVLKIVDIVIQVTLIICLNIDTKGVERFLNMCGIVLLWQLASSIIHFFVKADWKRKSLRTLWISALLASSVFAILFLATFVLAFFSVLLALFCGPVLILIYLVTSIGELKAINNELKDSKHIDHIQPY